MFRAVGQVMHLLQDASQPQHVRNEQHLERPIPGLGTPWLSPIEQWGLQNVRDLNYGDGSMLDWQGLGFTKLEDFWDRHIYEGSYVALNNDANGGTQLGLAEFVNGNFIGVRHAYSEYYKSSSIQYYPFPSRNISTDYFLKKNYLSSGINNYKLHNGYEATGIYLAKNDTGVAVAHHSRFTYFGVKHPEKAMPKSMTIDDPNVLYDYHEILVAKAVEYSAGFLDYFFRGQLAISIEPGTDIGTYIFGITNISSQDFKDGSFTLLKQDAAGNREIVTTFTITGTLATGSRVDMQYADSSLTTNTQFFVVYKGTIGITGGSASDPTDAGIAIAAKKFGVYGNEKLTLYSCERTRDGDIRTPHVIPAGLYFSPISTEDADSLVPPEPSDCN